MNSNDTVIVSGSMRILCFRVSSHSNSGLSDVTSSGAGNNRFSPYFRCEPGLGGFGVVEAPAPGPSKEVGAAAELASTSSGFS